MGKIVRYFLCEPIIERMTRYPKKAKMLARIGVSWSAIYYPDLEHATSVCVRIEYEEEKLNEIVDAVQNLRTNTEGELKTDIDWEKIKKFGFSKDKFGE